MRVISRALLAVVVCLLIPGGIESQGRSSLQSSRALWVVRDALVTPAGIRQMVEDASRAEITDLLVQVRGRGDAYYRSTLEPIAAPLKDSWKRHGEFDPLEVILEEAAKRGMRVHAWLNVYLVAGEWPSDGKHVLRRHPEWSAVDSRQRPFTQIGVRALAKEHTEGIYLDAGNAGVVNHFVEVVREIAETYAVDGIHLDYVRYPFLDSGYSDLMRNAFRRKHGVDPLELAWNREGLRQERGGEGLDHLQTQWNQFRADKVTALVHQVRQTLRATRPGVVLSAAVKPDPDAALSRYGQDWIRWVKMNMVDVVAPMMYSKSTSEVQEQVARTLLDIPPERVWAGIAAYNQSLDSVEAKIQAMETAGVGGISIFSYNSMPQGVQGLKRLMRVR